MESKFSCLRDFDVICKLGEGAFGQVFKVKRKQDNKQYALKKVKIGAMKQKQRDNALNQIRILASYDGEYIIGYKQAFYDQNSGSLCVVMQFASEGDILKKNQIHLKARTKYKQQQIWKALVQMTKGLKSLHDKKILHRDLKCANVFITADGTYKLGDLNVSKVLKKDLACTQTGTPYYASPQVWKDKPYGVKSDIWSLGCVLYEMAALRPPFTATDLQGLYRKVCAGFFDRIPMSYSNDLANTISSLLKVDPSKRPDTDQILSNLLVHKNYNGQINVDIKQDECDQLLKTLKYNPKDLKGLGKILPKANYEVEDKEQKKIHLQQLRGGINSCKNSRKQINIKEQIKKSIDVNDKKLQDFLQKRRKLQQEQRLKKLKIMNQQKEKQQIQKKRERVLSACGIRQPYMCQSPRIAVHKQMDNLSNQMGINSNKIPRKQQNKNISGNQAMKLPPKPQGVQQNINYKLPPKPVYNNQSGSNKSVDYGQKDKQRQKSKQNLRNAGYNVLNSNNKPNVPTQRPASSRIGRSNSSQKVVYPSWWG